MCVCVWGGGGGGGGRLCRGVNERKSYVHGSAVSQRSSALTTWSARLFRRLSI